MGVRKGGRGKRIFKKGSATGLSEYQRGRTKRGLQGRRRSREDLTKTGHPARQGMAK